MSGTFPTSPAPASMTVKSVQPTRVSITQNLKRQVRGGTVQRWAFSLQWTALFRSELAPILAFALAQKGQYESFAFVPPVLSTAQTAGGAWSPKVNGAHTGGRTVNTRNWSPFTAIIYKAGDFIKFAGHNKVYMVTADAGSDDLGRMTVSIEPGLYAPLADLEAISYPSVPFTVAFAGDAQETGINPGIIATYACDLVEVL
jgi:hypothetical protein